MENEKVKVLIDKNIPKDLLNFQIHRNIISLGKTFLLILEDNRDYILKLEKLMFDMGLEGYEIGLEKYQKDRKRCLDETNYKIRELQNFIEKFDINLRE